MDDNFKTALASLEMNPSWNRNRKNWRNIKESLDRSNERLADKSLETVVSSHRDLPDVLTRMSKLFSRKWWAEVIDGDGGEAAMDILISYLRLVRIFYHRRPEMNLEKTSTTWAMGILRDLSAQASSNSEPDEQLTIAIIEANFAPDDLLENLAEAKFAKSLDNARQASDGLFWTLPARDLRRLLSWACSLARLGSYQSKLKEIVDSVEPASAVLSPDCLAMFERLKRSIRYDRE